MSSPMGKALKTVLLEIAEERETVVREYSGRGMMGKSCIAIVVWPQDSLALMGHIVHRMHTLFIEDHDNRREPITHAEWLDFNDDVYEFCQTRPQIDNLGDQCVMYWPEITWEETQS